MEERELFDRLVGERRILVVAEERDVRRLPPLRELARGGGFALLANR